MRALALIWLVNAACAPCHSEPCTNQIVGAQLELAPVQLSSTLITVCVDGACESATYGDVQTSASDAWRLVLGPCLTVSLDSTDSGPGGSFMVIEPTMPTTCTDFPLQLGDTMRLTITDASGALLFDKSHTVTYQGSDSCGAACDKLATRF